MHGPFLAASLDWGDVPTWVSAIFALFAFAAALSLFLIEFGRDRRQEAVDRSTQAQRVTAWVKQKPGWEMLELSIQNASGACIYDFFAAYTAYDTVLGYQPMDTIVPSDDPTRYDVDLEVVERYIELNHSIDHIQVIRPVLYFRDSGNRIWRRDYYGHLTEIDRDHPGLKVARGWLTQWTREQHERRVDQHGADEAQKLNRLGNYGKALPEPDST